MYDSHTKLSIFLLNLYIDLLVKKEYNKIVNIFYKGETTNMRKFYKFFTLVLVLVAILTAFTVVAIADEDSTPQPIVGKSDDFSSYAEGYELNRGYTDRKAIAVVSIQDDENKYALLEQNPDFTNNNDSMWDISPSNSGNIVEYPYFMIEFDIMTIDGNYTGHQFYPRLSNGTFIVSTSFTKLGLSTTPYDWNHLSILVEYVGNGKFISHSYVNGKQAGTPLSTVVDAPETVKINAMKLYPSANAKVGIDNLYITYFPDGYLDGNISDIANYRYNYGKGTDGNGYDFPYTYTKAWIGDTPYDDLSEAVAAAPENATVKLAGNVEEAFVIDKNILIDTNVYDENGNTTGNYTYEYKSSKGFVPTETAPGSGIYSFARSADAVDIIWDEACEGGCDCFSEYGGHALTATTTVFLGEIPEYFGKLPTWEFDTSDYSQKEFIGWSYENDGTVDELVEITGADAGETIKLYPVYKKTEYSFAVISNGKTDYYVEEEFGTQLKNAPSGATVKLLRDVYTEVSTLYLKNVLTIDLNGHSLKRCFVYGTVYEATKNGDDFLYDTTTVAKTITSSGQTFFQYYATNAALTITSSTGSGTLYNLQMQADTWTYENEVVKRTSKAVTTARLTYAGEGYQRDKNISLTINGGITVYAGTLFYSAHAAGLGYTFTVDNVKYYKLDNTDFIYCRTNGRLDISLTNSLIYAPNNSGYFFNLGTSGTGTGKAEVKITNCDVVKAGTGWGFYGQINRTAGTTNVIFDNCRLYDAAIEISNKCDAEVIGTNGTLCYSASGESYSVNSAEGYSEVQLSTITVKYSVPVTTQNGANFEVTSDVINTPTFNFATTTRSCYFNRIITKAVDVNWVDGNGKTVKTEKLTPGVSALEAPRVVFALDSDDYRNILAQWVDEDGKAVAFTSNLGVTAGGVDWKDSYTFRAVETIDGTTYQYTGGIKDVYFNISYYSNFRYNLYLPERDTNITFGDITLLKKGELVKIGGVEYRAYSYIAGTAAAADDTEVTLKFTYDGDEYEQIFKLSALLYADIVLPSSDIAEEKLAVGNMARFIMEARKATGLVVDEERFNAILTAAGVDDGYAANYVGEGTIDNLKNYIYSVNYLIYNGAASYKFTLYDADYADVLTFTLNGKEISYTVGTETIEEIEYTYLILDSAKVYDIIDTLTITVDGTELSATYSMLDNIEANPEENLLKALYEFGIAAENYRAYLQAL